MWLFSTCTFWLKCGNSDCVLCAAGAGAGGGKQAQRKVTLRVTGATQMPRWCPAGARRGRTDTKIRSCCVKRERCETRSE